MTNPDQLGAATDRVVMAVGALVPDEKRALVQALGSALGDWIAELANRSTALAAGAVMHVFRRVEDLEARERRRSERITELQRQVNGQVDQLWKYQLSEERRAALIATIERLASASLIERIEALEQKAVGGDGSG